MTQRWINNDFVNRRPHWSKHLDKDFWAELFGLAFVGAEIAFLLYCLSAFN